MKSEEWRSADGAGWPAPQSSSFILHSSFAEPAESRLGVIGFPIGHTLSPDILSAALAAIGLPASYGAYEVTPEELPRFLEQLRRPEWRGVNVTVPHKQAVLAAMDELSVEARAIGAVNTIRGVDGRLAGFNTDSPAFRAEVEAAFGSLAGKRVAILGAGGAARAVCHALKDGPSALWIWNRHPERAQELSRHFPHVALLDDLRRLRDVDLLVNCTSAGLRPGESPIPDECVPADVSMYDLIYNPPTTRLMQLVEARGGRAVNGLGMLVRQAALALEIWTERTPPLDVMFEAARRGLAQRQDGMQREE
ncbi:MAG: shikimate dehydrogenase [Chloroflexota bacterium]|nr:shikimate dehydrogenase [Chloroflexota bacterium]